MLDENRFQEEFPDASELPSDPRDCAARLVRADLLTTYQANQLLAGKHRGFHLGSYKILRPIGQGGMGIVYLAEHSELRRKVALKVLTGDRSKDKGALERFLREARAAAALDHPNIVRIHDVCQQSQVRFLVMEYVEGESLEAVLKKGGAISQSRSVDYISQAAVGLQHAYEKGFVHRDIKPANLMLTRDGTIKILDMGLARSLTNPADSLTEVLEDGAVLGTADYIAPEQAMGSKEVDIRADIYSLGATFFALVTGKPPFSGTTTQKLAQHQMKEAPSLTAIDKTFPPGLADVVDKMLEKKPGKRYQTPADVVAALAEWLPDTGAARVVAGLTGTDEGQSEKMQAALTGIVSGTSKRIRKSRRRKQRKQLILIGAAAGAAVLVGVVVTLLLIGGKTDEVGPGPGA
ncbi:MAG TPA: serine/threonine-protein kinase, partial [Gemmataceae bacterium]|nr:serine/threonine-protein kinase [Gemmataceae bacterium]